MATVTITIHRSDVYSIAEGISTVISQHNAGTPTYEQLWASPSEAKKLDIYYREAISDLERRLMTWENAVSAQFDLSADGSDYTMQLRMAQYWPPRLEGLLANKVQDYLVHAVTAGWLNDFDGLTVKQDYVSMAAQDITDIREIIHQRGFDFQEETRQEDTDDKDINDGGSASARGEDTDQKDVNDGGDAGRRREDQKKDMTVLPFEAGYRKKDDVIKEGPDDKPFLCKTRTDRHRDNATVCPRTDWTDMSGTGIAYRNEMCPPPPTRPMMGRGYTPQPEHRPVPPCPPIPTPPPPMPPHPHIPMPPPCDCKPYTAQPVRSPKNDPAIYPEPPYHAVPKKYPPVPPLPKVHPNGIDWSDMQHYDEKAEEKFINSHDCGHHDCGHHGVNQLDWEFEENTEGELDDATFNK